MRVGEIVARVGDAVKVRQFLSVTLVGLLLNPLVIVCSVAAMFFYSAKLAVLALGLLPIFAVVQWLTNRLNRRYQRHPSQRVWPLFVSFLLEFSVPRTIQSAEDARRSLSHVR
jgi:ABC-type bacteriocin/lantibiotic exporter with double-glycine peptidase domain